MQTSALQVKIVKEQQLRLTKWHHEVSSVTVEGFTVMTIEKK
jgi:hypothetical protein